jgi:hypothetical protein
VKRRGVAVAATVAVLLAGSLIAADRVRSQHHDGAAGSGDNDAAVSTATVARRTLAARTSLSGTLGYAGDYTVGGQGHGTLTWLPAVGQVIRQGQLLYRLDGQPVILLYGSVPAYRRLAEGENASDVTGTDVAQLNRDLVALGYASSDELDASSDEFGWATKAAIERLQEHLGVKQTGALELGQVVFLPTAARVTSVSATLGGPAGGAVLKASSTRRQVVVNLDANLQSQVTVGETVTITLPNGHTTPGRVTSVGKVATAPASGSNSTSTVEVDITPTDPAATGTLDKASVQVAIITDTARNALVVPVNALLALAGGGYAVEVIAADRVHRLAPVQLGLFDDGEGLVQVSGSGLAVGQRVVVPAS